MWHVLAIAFLIGACSGGPTASTELAVSPVALDLLVDGETSHEVPDLEAKLPATVAGIDMATWSVRGARFYGFAGPVPPEELKSIEAELALDGLVLDDVGYALAAPAGVGATQGSFVYAYRFAGVSADRYPIIAIDHPEAGAWTERTIGGQPVLVGVEAMLEQGDYVRGRPYIYNSGDTRFVVVTDDEAWAVDALSQLP